MKFIKLAALFLLFNQLSCAQQNEKQALLVGKWKEYKTEWMDSQFVAEARPIGCFERKYEFKSNGNLIETFIKESDSFKYCLKNDTLFVDGSVRYIIEKISKTDLVLLDAPYEKHKFAGQRHLFKKVDRFD